MGQTNLENLDKSSIQNEKIKPVGWVRLYGLPDKDRYETINQPQELEYQPDIFWTYDTGDNSNDFYSSSVIKDDILFSTTSSGELYALDVEDGQLLWNVSIGNQPTVPAIYDDKLFIGTTEGLKMLDIGWMIQGGKPLGKIVSRPVVANNRVIVGDENGNIYAFDTESGDEQWNAKLPDEIYISQPWNGSLFIGSGDKCYKINRRQML